VRELETVRNFLTGQALTSAIDVPFTLLFLAILYVYSPLLALIVTLSIPCTSIAEVSAWPVRKLRTVSSSRTRATVWPAGLVFAILYVYSPLLALIVTLSIPCYILVAVLLRPVLRLAHPGDGLAGGPRLKVAEGQAHQVVEQPRAELDVDPASRSPSTRCWSTAATRP
jgi:ABC-type bacteriocin/lantibiotic exporter with double-glycine peptidase domain